MIYRWLEPDEIVALVNPVLAHRGWPQLNADRAVSRVMGAFDAENLVEIFVLQLFPLLGPMLRIDNTLRDNGCTSRELSRRMEEFLAENQARGWMAIADSPVTERLCERHGMQRIASPVFIDRGV